MNSQKLLISFWNISLDNLPEGTFIRRRITPDDARRYIEQARLANALLCVSDVRSRIELAPWAPRAEVEAWDIYTDSRKLI